MTIALIAANVVVFLLEIRAGGSFWSGPTPKDTVDYGLIPWEVTHWGKHCDLDQVTQQVVCEGQPGVIGHASAQPSTIVQRDGSPSDSESTPRLDRARRCA